MYNTNVPAPLVDVGSGSLRACFGRRSRKGLFLCDSEAAAYALLSEGLINVVVRFLKGGSVKAV